MRRRTPPGARRDLPPERSGRIAPSRGRPLHRACLRSRKAERAPPSLSLPGTGELRFFFLFGLLAGRGLARVVAQDREPRTDPEKLAAAAHEAPGDADG